MQTINRVEMKRHPELSVAYAGGWGVGSPKRKEKRKGEREKRRKERKSVEKKWIKLQKTVKKLETFIKFVHIYIFQKNFSTIILKNSIKINSKISWESWKFLNVPCNISRNINYENPGTLKDSVKVNSVDSSVGSIFKWVLVFWTAGRLNSCGFQWSRSQRGETYW